jgi:hypothetical protein
MSAHDRPVPSDGGRTGPATSEDDTALPDDTAPPLDRASDNRLDVLASGLQTMAARLDAHEHHHAADLTGLFEALQQTLQELSLGVGGNGDLSWAVRGVRQLRAHLRRLDDRADRLEQGARTGGAGARTPTEAGQVGSLFDYVGFEREFRGDAAAIQAAQVERYADLVAAAPGPVVDVGCGRGEFLQHLRGRAVQVVGVEPDEQMADAAEAAGVPVPRCTASVNTPGQT